MKLKRVIPTLAAAACGLLALPAVSSAQTTTNVQQAASANWAGYVAGGSGQTYKSVSGSWVAPTATCSGGRSYSAFWVGLGGAGQGRALEQVGTEADCTSNGSPSYFAWYELVPHAPVATTLAVHPGDRMTGRVTVSGHSVTVALADETTGDTFTKTLTMANPDTSSAEWIAEAPSSCRQSTSNCTPLPLTDFGTVRFTGASATTSAGHTGSISDPAWSAAAVALSPSATTTGYGGPQLTAAGSTGGATPSSLSRGGSSFSVAYGPASSGAVSSTGDGGYGGYGYGSGYGGYGYGYGYGYGAGGAVPYGYGGSGSTSGGWYVYVPPGY